MEKKAVVVTTEHRGVFFGYIEDKSKLPAEITLTQARMCVYWSLDTRGVLGLASHGPKPDCKITHAIPRFVAYKITSLMECSPEATENWEKGIWK